MSTLITGIVASVVPSVPDSSSTALLLGLGIFSLGMVARLIKSRKK
jgi:hypothetical protein